MEMWGGNGQSLEPCKEEMGYEQTDWRHKKGGLLSQRELDRGAATTGTVMQSKEPPPSRQASPTP